MLRKYLTIFKIYNSLKFTRYVFKFFNLHIHIQSLLDIRQKTSN